MRSRQEAAPARLEWWANGETCLLSVPVRVTAGSDGRGWEATVAAGPGSRGGEEPWQLVLDDPLFTLRLADGSGVPVEAEPSGDALRLREAAAPTGAAG